MMMLEWMQYASPRNAGSSPYNLGVGLINFSRPDHNNVSFIHVSFVRPALVLIPQISSSF